MKKNILTIIIMAIVLINTALTAILIFTIVPSAQRTSKLIDRVSSIIDLEMEAAYEEEDVSVGDIASYDITDKLTINLLDDGSGKSHYAQLTVSINMNKKNEDFTELSEKVGENENAIKEIVTDEFSKYTFNEVKPKKDKIKEDILVKMKDYFHSDFIINVSFGNIILQ